jgi:hypothetical protein
MSQEKIDYEKLGSEIGKLITSKQAAYGDSFHKSGEVMKQLYPNGIPVSNYVDVLAIVRIIDKLFRLATDPNYNNENSWADIAGYSLLRLGDVKNKTDKLPKKDEWKTQSGARLQSEEDIVVQSKDTNWYDFNNPELRDSGIR